jgi:hypothetical protein
MFLELQTALGAAIMVNLEAAAIIAPAGEKGEKSVLLSHSGTPQMIDVPYSDLREAIAAEGALLNDGEGEGEAGAPAH